jgi:hypothetical protein
MMATSQRACGVAAAPSSDQLEIENLRRTTADLEELGLQTEITEGLRPHRDEHECSDGITYQRELRRKGLEPRCPASMIRDSDGVRQSHTSFRGTSERQDDSWRVNCSAADADVLDRSRRAFSTSCQVCSGRVDESGSRDVWQSALLPSC